MIAVERQKLALPHGFTANATEALPEIDFQVRTTYQTHLAELPRNDGCVLSSAAGCGENACRTHHSADVGGVRFPANQNYRFLDMGYANGGFRIQSDRAAICGSPVAYGSLRAANCTKGFVMYTLSHPLVQKVGQVTKPLSLEPMHGDRKELP